MDGVDGKDRASEGPLARLAGEAIDAFRAALEDDLNSAQALAALFVFVNHVNGELDAAVDVAESELEAARGALASMDEVIGLLSVAREGLDVDDDFASEIESLIAERKAARADRRLRARGCHPGRAGRTRHRAGGFRRRHPLEANEVTLSGGAG